jgi:macrolide-specific efflux system membrane fusion protein
MWKKINIKIKVASLVVILVLGWLGYTNWKKSQTTAQTYQTGTATLGTMVVSVSGSGTISSANSAAVNTTATGVVKKVYVHDNDVVKTGQKLADLTLDLPGQQQSAQAWASYLGAKNALASAQSTLYTTQSDMFTQWNTYYTQAISSTYQDSNGNPINRDLVPVSVNNDNWLAAQAKYKNQQNVVAQQQSAVSSTWLSYQQASATIVAPIDGTIHGLSIVEGSVIPAGTQNSNGTNSSVKVANIVTSAQPLVSVSLTEIDVPKVKEGERATVTATSQPNKTYTGKVMSVNIVGAVSSGVTSYPVIIQLDTDATELLPNMSVQANIITTTKDNALLVPTSAVTTKNGQATVRVMRNGQPVTTDVTTGLTSDTETEITSGLSDGDTIVTSAPITTTTGSSGQTTSIFSALTGNRGGAAIGGGAARVVVRGN